MMRILVTFAVEAEFAPWRKLRKFRFIDFDGLRLWRSNTGSQEITALVTGMGTQSAAKAMDLMMRLADQNQHFDICISSGLAGALEESLSPGDIIAPQLLISENSHADLQSEQLNVDPELHRQALDGGAKAADCLLTVDRVLVKQSHKRACSSRAQSVDMESFEIVKEACAWGARSVVVRAISDSAREDLPIDFNLTLSKNHQVSLTKVILQLAKNPFVLPSLVRFARQSRKAARLLAVFLDGYVKPLESTGTEKRASQVAAK
jgi:adenosylhomocysteine nucleosidase